ncbi:papain-like cysteine protease family protein, partial [Erythrobacter donghaensis]|uniref:papain-like cysteine protease family protein n=11 Tax=Erythrobacter donghaensis TaxID=267135 RepID=UPI000B23C50F
AGGSSSSAWQNSSRALAASSGQNLLDRTNQAASAVRSQRASVVVGSEQSEGLSITSEIVANYNHCHAMTMEYFEVLQHFRVDQELAHVGECLFIPLEIRPFDMLKAQRWRDILQYRLRRPRLSRGFAAIERILQSYVDSGLPTGRYADEPITELSGELRLQLRIANPRARNAEEEIDAYLASAWNFWNTLFGSNTARQAYDSAIADRDLANRIFEREYAPRVARAYCDRLKATLLVRNPNTGEVKEESCNADFTMVSSYRPDGLHLVTFRATRIPANVTRADIVAIRFSSDLDTLSPNSVTTLRSANVVYATAFRQHELVPRRSMNNDIIGDDTAQIPTRLLSRSEERSPRAEDRDAVSALLKHLNEFVEHYHQVIWWRMDPNRRFMLLDGFVAPNSGGRSLASVVENRVISIVGNSLVMPVAPGYRLDPLMREADAGKLDLLELYRPPVPLPPRRISLPTRGVHAEAILGECNSCMVRDDTRFWHWESEKFPGVEPPQIAESSTATRRQAPLDTEPDSLAAPVVAIQNAPAAPDPTPITALGTLLTQQGLFKDITGLEGNQKNAAAAFEQALKTGNAFAKMAAGGAKEAFANRNAERTMKKIDEAREAKILSEADAKEVVAHLFGVPPGKEGAKAKPLTEDPSVAKGLAKVQEKPGKKKVTVTTNTGSTSQTVETEFESAGSPAAPKVAFRIADVPPLKQPSPETCWAVALTMLLSEQRQQSLPVETALLTGGEAYVEMFRQGKPLPLQQLGAFIADFKLKEAATAVLTASTVEAALRRHGPLWVVGDEQAGAGFSVHARVITGIAGDGTPAGTQVYFNDPAAGQAGEETLKLFTEKLAELMEGARSAFGGIAPMVLAL